MFPPSMYFLLLWNGTALGLQAQQGPDRRLHPQVPRMVPGTGKNIWGLGVWSVGGLCSMNPSFTTLSM